MTRTVAPEDNVVPFEPRRPALTGTWQVDSADLASVMAAKASVMAFLRSRGSDEAAYEDCALALSELLSNAVRHAHPGPIEVSLDWRRERPKLTVTNAGAPFAMSLEKPGFDRESGRGLYILAHVLEPPVVEGVDGRCRVSISLPVSRA